MPICQIQRQRSAHNHAASALSSLKWYQHASALWDQYYALRNVAYHATQAADLLKEVLECPTPAESASSSLSQHPAGGNS